MTNNRTQSAFKNVKTGFIVQIINKIMTFVVRTFFIQYLNNTYLGINGLFTNILTILSFAELGIGTAIIYNMYKPVATGDKEKIKSYMCLYKKTYTLIGIIIFLLGLLVIPFLDYLVGDISNIEENIVVIYLLFLINSSCSYFFTYKKSIIIAHQKQSIINNIDSVFYILISLIEIFFLIITKNFIIYLIIQIIGTMLENLYISHISNKMYPYLKGNNKKQISNNEKKSIFKNIKSLIVYKFGAVIMNGTDNILISLLINVTTVGLVSNYNLIINATKTIFETSLSGVTASIGNLNAIGEKEKKEKTYYDLTYIYFMVYSFCSFGFIFLLNPFIKLWLGADYILDISISIALAISFFIDGMRQSGFIYRTTLGMFQKGRITPYIGAFTNIVLSIILCKLFGLVGIFIATSIAQLLSYSWIDTYILYKYEFNKSPKKFYKKYIKYFLVYTIEFIILFSLIENLNFSPVLDFIIRLFIVIFIPNIVNIFIFRNSDEFKSIYTKLFRNKKHTK